MNADKRRFEVQSCQSDQLCQDEPQRLALDQREGEASHARQLTVCQVNICEGGKWKGRRHHSASYDTAKRFADFVASTNPVGSPWPSISLIGMQEIDETDRRKMELLLQDQTQSEWQSARTPQGIDDDSGVGMFWRTDLVEPAVGGDLGEVVVGKLDNGYVIKFAGRVFRTSAGERVAFFTGKLAWQDAIINGKPITQEERRMQARRLRSWIRESLAEPPDLAVIAMDLNAPLGSPAWREMNVEYIDPSRQKTFNSLSGSMAMDLLGKRLDYLWLYRTANAAFADGPHRSPHFGSDHRAVYGTVEFRSHE